MVNAGRPLTSRPSTVRSLALTKRTSTSHPVRFSTSPELAPDGCGASIINLNTDAVKKLVADNPFYAFATIPKGTYKTSKKDVTTFGVMASFVTSADVSDDLVYAVVKAVFENLDDFKKQHPAFANLDPKKMIVDGLSAPLHPGAVKYYKEKGLM